MLLNPYLLTLAEFVAVGLYAAVTTALWGKATASEALHEMVVEDGPAKLLLWMGSIIVGEELFFRLLLVGVLGRQVWVGFVPLSVLLFSLSHLPNVRAGQGRLRLFVLHLGTGAFLTYVFLAHGLWTALACHALFNALTVIRSRLGYRLKPAALREARRRVYGPQPGALVLPSGVDDPWQLPAQAQTGARGSWARDGQGYAWKTSRD